MAPEAWIWEAGRSGPVVSRRLRRILAAADGPGAARLYGAAGLPAGHVVLVGVLPFRDGEAAAAYAAQSGVSVETTGAGIRVTAPQSKPGMDRWRATLVEGRVAAEIDCWLVESDRPAPACETVVRSAAEALRGRLREF
jgi:hypothetical protein